MNTWLGWGLMCVAILLCGNSAQGEAAKTITISSPAFANGKPMPARYAETGENISPPLHFDDIPASAKSLVLIVDDPDAPAGLWTHWIMWNVAPTTRTVAAGKPPQEARTGKNSSGDIHYYGPKPPSGTHRYFFHLFALDEMLSLSAGAKRADLEAAMQGHVIATGQMVGTYSAAP